MQSPAFGEAMELDGVLPETVLFLVESLAPDKCTSAVRAGFRRAQNVGA